MEFNPIMLMQVLTLQIESPTKHIKTTKTRRSNLIRDQVRRLAERLLLPPWPSGGRPSMVAAGSVLGRRFRYWQRVWWCCQPAAC